MSCIRISCDWWDDDIDRWSGFAKCLASNLVAAAIGCWSFAMGETYEMDVAARNVPQWWPGCALPKPETRASAQMEENGE